MSGIAGTITPRQVEVLALMRDGLTIKEAAARLDISPFTVRNLTNDAIIRLGASNGAHAIVIAMRCGYITLPHKVG